MWRFTLPALAAVLAAGCVGHPTLEPGTSRTVLTAAEIVAAHVTDAYQAVVQLRPEYVVAKPTAIPGARASATVYLDRQRLGGVEELRSIPLERVRLIRFVSRNEADLLFGGTHPAGAILVRTLK